MSIKRIKYIVRYNRKHTLNKEGKAPIEIELSKDGRCIISTGIYITPRHWSEEANTIINDTKLKQEFQQFQNTLLNSENHIIAKQGHCTINDLINELEKKKDVNETFHSFAMECFKSESSLSQKRKDDIKRILLDFKDYSKDIKIRDISIKLLNEYKGYLEEKEYHVNTIQHRFKIYKKYATKAVEYDLLEYTKNPFDKFKIKGEKTNRVFLGIDEVKKIEAIKFNPQQKALELARDMFLFQCYTGLRFSDVSVLNCKNIRKSKEGLFIDNAIAQKTNKSFYLPLYALFKEKKGKDSKPERILKKYWNDNGAFFATQYSKSSNDRANNQYINRLLKDIQKLAEIDKTLTTHVGRHTFATYMIYKVPLPVVSEMLQHSDLDTTSIYLHVRPEHITKELLKVIDWQ